jgi:endo-1,4-beta-mannosidase
MHFKQIRRLSLVLGLAAISATFILAAQPSQKADADKMHRLMLERRDILLKIVETFKSRYERGTIKIDAVYRAQSDLLSAELDLAKTREDRLAALNSQLANCQSIETRAVELQKVGAQGGEVESVLTATAARLQAEIQILRESSTDNR